MYQALLVILLLCLSASVLVLQVQHEYDMLFETAAADPEAVLRWRNRALRFVLPPAGNDATAGQSSPRPAPGMSFTKLHCRFWYQTCTGGVVRNTTSMHAARILQQPCSRTSCVSETHDWSFSMSKHTSVCSCCGTLPRVTARLP